MLLPAVSLLMAVFLTALAFGGIRGLARHMPSLINIPDKSTFLALRPDDRVAVMGPIMTFLVYLAAIESMLFLWIVESTGRVAAGQSRMLAVWPVFCFVFAIIAGLPFFIKAIGDTMHRFTHAERAGLQDRQS